VILPATCSDGRTLERVGTGSSFLWIRWEFVPVGTSAAEELGYRAWLHKPYERTRSLKANSATDLGIVARNGWGGVVINWDDGRTGSIHHNDMGAVTVVPVKK